MDVYLQEHMEEYSEETIYDLPWVGLFVLNYDGENVTYAEYADERYVLENGEILSINKSRDNEDVYEPYDCLKLTAGYFTDTKGAEFKTDKVNIYSINGKETSVEEWEGILKETIYGRLIAERRIHDLNQENIEKILLR